MKILHILTTPQSTGFLKGQAAFMRSHGTELHIVSSPGPGLTEFARREQVPIHEILMQRRISPLEDLSALFRMFLLFRRECPDVVHAHTPKASLIGITAAWLARVPARIFHVHGLPHSTATGLLRFILRWSTRIPALLATQIISVSRSCAAMAMQEGLCTKIEIAVLGNGSSNGVDASYLFNPFRHSETRREDLLGIEREALVIGFAGRLVRDKGVSELYHSWRQIREEFPQSYLIVAGEPERRDALPEYVLQGFRSDPRVRMLGQVKDMAAFYACLDVFVLPTYREGLPTVILESAAMGVPAIGFRCVGCVDAVLDGLTGTLVAPGDCVALTDATRNYLKDAELRTRHGLAARERVLRDFKPQDVWQATLEQYRRTAHLSLTRQRSRSARLCKRSIDVAISLLTLVLLSPLMALVALLVRISMGTPVLFRQRRPGLNERLFEMIKFRTMRDAVDETGRPLPDAQRLTRFGRFLRKSSLDELPELWNVLRGDMSLVGPRPLLAQYLGRYNEFERRRHEVKPGLTGWAQIRGRNSLSWEEKFRLDIWYVDHRSLFLDLKILLRTLAVVIQGTGTASQEHATMPEFGLASNSLSDSK